MRQVNGWVWIILLSLGLVACEGGPGGIGGAPGRVNVTQAAGLSQTRQLEIIELLPTGQPGDRRVTVTDSATIQSLVTLLSRDLALGPLARCPGQYRLRFQLSTGQVQEFEHLCQGGPSFLRGSQPFWQGQQVQPPAEFDQVIQRLIVGNR